LEEAVEAQAFISLKKAIEIGQYFRLLGEEPMTVSGRLSDVLAEAFRMDCAKSRAEPPDTFSCWRMPAFGPNFKSPNACT